jgi:5-methylcytosine-specific restriction enzyme subunit McrC
MATRELVLVEFATTPRVFLTGPERDTIRDLHPGLRIDPSRGAENCYELTPDQHVGVVVLPGLNIRVLPKVPMSSVLFLVQHACGVIKWSEGVPDYAMGSDLVDLVAMSLAKAIVRATRQGLLHGYRTEEDAVHAPRGRILFDQQLRRRLRLSAPVEVRYDDFTSDMIENQLLLSAVTALLRLPLGSPQVRAQLTRARMLFGGVTVVRFAPSRIPEIPVTRLNRHYEPALRLAGLVLRSACLDIQHGPTRGSAFLVDMNEVFERFVRQALRITLGATAREFPDRPPQHHLDERDVVPLRPDLTLLSTDRPIWIGDAKYKRLPVGGYRNADLYQVLAYCIRFGLASGMLIYASADGVGAEDHVVRMSGKTLRVRTLDLAAPVGRIRIQIEEIGAEIRQECEECLANLPGLFSVLQTAG